MVLSDFIFQLLQFILPLLLIIVYVYYKWVFQYWKSKGVPFLEPKPFIGNIVDIVGDEVTGFYNQVKPKGWKYCGLYLLTKPVLLLLDLDLIKNILATDFSSFVDRGIFVNEKDEPIAANIFAVGGVRWRNLRLKFSPHFSTTKLKNTFDIQARCGKTMENYLKTLDLNEPIDVKAILSSFTIDVIGTSAFGIECNNFKQLETSPFRKYGELTFSKTLWIKVKTSISRVFPRLAKLLRFTLFRANVRAFFHSMVVKTVTYREENNVQRNDFLQMMIDLKNKRGEEAEEFVGDGNSLTMNEIIAQCFVFYNAGFETSATTMTFCLYELATHQEIQEKVRDEIIKVLREHKGISYEVLKELRYMEQVISETLRKYPALAFITRVCVNDYQVPGSDITIEKGTEIFIPIKAIHYDAEYYEEPEKFDPDRFSSEKLNKRHRYAHIPFGEGPRMCIGARLGVMTTKMGLYTVLKKFKVSLNEKTRLPLQLSTRTTIPTVEGGIWLNLERLGYTDME